MPMIAGTVDATGTGSGLALAMFLSERTPIVNDSSLSASLKTALLTGLAAKCVERATVLVVYVQANATVAREFGARAVGSVHE